MRFWNFRGEQNTIAEALQLKVPDHAVISFTGAGGKTSLMCALAGELSASGRKTVITTTTHMLHPGQVPADHPYNGIQVIYCDPDSAGPDNGLCADISSALEENPLIMAVSPDPQRPQKVTQPSQWLLEHLYHTADAVLIEADGSRRKPFKWPAPWEPVVPGRTDITICVAGLTALGGNMRDVMYGTEYMPESLIRDTVDEQLMNAVLSSIDGGRRGETGEFRVFLNQADTGELALAASRIQMMLAVCGIQSAWGTLAE